MTASRKLFSTKHFTWLHVPKTGGTWLHEVLTRHAPPSWDASYGPPAHVCLHEVPMALEHWNKKPERVGLPVLASVRNPWDWYVSLYFFLEQHRVNGTGGFAVPRAQWPRSLVQWEQSYGKGNSVAGFRQSMPSMMGDFHERSILRIAPPQTYFLRNPDGSLGVVPVRFEGLRQNVLDTLGDLGVEVTSQLRNHILKSPKANQSGHASYVHCYDDATRRLVEKYDGWLVDTFEYRFGHS